MPDIKPMDSLCLPLKPASKLSLRFLANRPSPILIFSSRCARGARPEYEGDVEEAVEEEAQAEGDGDDDDDGEEDDFRRFV